MSNILVESGGSGEDGSVSYAWDPFPIFPISPKSQLSFLGCAIMWSSVVCGKEGVWMGRGVVAERRDCRRMGDYILTSRQLVCREKRREERRTLAGLVALRRGIAS